MQLSFLKNVHFVDQENTSKISVILEVDPSMILKVVKNTILGATPKILSLKIHQLDRTDNLKKFFNTAFKRADRQKTSKWPKTHIVHICP